MKSFIKVIFFIIVLLLFKSSSIYSMPLENNTPLLDNQGKHKILIICSYNPATRRVTDFLNDFQNLMLQNNISCVLNVESMDCRSINRLDHWKFKIKKIIKKYESQDIKAIILIGQEAWASYLALDKKYRTLPCFVSSASTNGILLNTRSEVISNKVLKSVDYKKIAEKDNNIGGLLNYYDFHKNIRLIENLYPEIQNIAFLSDYTYGGLSLQAAINDVFNKDVRLKSLNLILIDARESLDKLKKSITNLPRNTAMLIGTWRLSKNNQFLLPNTLIELFDERRTMPIFTISGSGLNSIALGGYIPKYSNGVEYIAKQLGSLSKNQKLSLETSPCEYVFNAQNVKKLNVSSYKLPKNTEFVNTVESQLSSYKKYLKIGIIIIIIIIVFLFVTIYLYFKSKKLEKNLLENTKQLTIEKNKALKSDRLKSTFLANMSHEIRTPLNAIIGFSALLIEEGEENKDKFDKTLKKEYINIIESNSDLLLNIINDILDISSLESGNVNFKFGSYNLYDVCSNAFVSIQHNTNGNIKFIFPKQRDTTEIYTDHKRLTQILVNLLSNAIKFTKKGSITLDYKIDKSQDLVYFSVTDTGSGVPLERQKSIFNRFEKLNDFVQGTGLGLSICKQIVTKFGGDIKVDENYKDGARFVFTHSLSLNKE